MGGIVIIVGGLAVLLGAFDVVDISGNKKSWQTPAAKIVGGLVVAGIGLLMKHFGI